MRYIVVFAIVFLLAVAGCSDDSTDVDHGFNLLSDFSLVSIAPSEFTPGEVTTLTFACETDYAGSARVEVTGHGGGQDVGELQSPIEASIGYALFRVDLNEGQNLIPLEIEMQLDYESVAVSVLVELDSLAVDSSLVDWESAEGRALYLDDVPANTAFIGNSSYLHVDLDRSADG